MNARFRASALGDATQRVLARGAHLAAAALLASCAGASDPKSGPSWSDAWWTVDAGIGPRTEAGAPHRELGYGDGADGAGTGAHTVQVVYLVPSDAKEKPEYKAALHAAAEHVRAWLGTQLGQSRSITLADPAVQVHVSDKPVAWFATNSRTEANDGWFHHNAVEDAANAGVDTKAEDRLWLIYVDAPAGCGQWNYGFFPVAVYTRNDLLGLVGQTTKNCDGQDQPAEPKCRWVGGMALLMSYAFGLAQPASCKNKEPSCPTDALTVAGFRKYPVTYYPAEDIAVLREHPFISEVELPDSLPSCE